MQNWLKRAPMLVVITKTNPTPLGEKEVNKKKAFKLMFKAGDHFREN
jgi:hypothetical protein